jgi:primary-amine oxidase
MDIQDFTNPDVIAQSEKHGYSHPLDPLSADEIRLARSIVQQLPELSGDTYFPAIRLLEPPKHIVRDFSAGQAFERRAWVVAHDFTTHELCDGVVSLDRREVLEWNARPGLQGPLLLQEYDAAIELIKLDPRWQDAIHRRGIDDLDTVRVDAWMIGNFGIPEHEGRRLCASLAYLRDQTPDLPYARPIEGVVAYVDLDTREVIEVLDPDPVPVPVDPGRYDPGAVGSLRADLRPIEIAQPEGVSFEVRGHEIAWCCTRSDSRMTASCGRSHTGFLCRRWWCRTGIQVLRTTGRGHLTSGISASDAQRTRSNLAATVWV